MSHDPFPDAGFTAVQRALGDFQAGNPIIIVGDGVRARLVLSVEALTQERLDRLRALAGDGLRLTISATKACLAQMTKAGAAWISLAEVDGPESIMELATGVEAASRRSPAPGERCDEAVVELAKLAHHLPAALTLPLTAAASEAFPTALRVAAVDILQFRPRLARSLQPVSRARIALRPDIASEFVVFRDALGVTWTAVVIGAPDFGRPVAVRLHSSCLTGDSFGSLRCDCGDQLRMSIDLLRLEGGVLLYLDQEGCGIGLANKMRAYALQDKGLDTIDANTALGFESDERRYDLAARMLQLLGVDRVFLLTNNPGKVAGLSEAGIRVVDRIPLIAPVHQNNRRYLDAKARRAGHLLDGLGEARQASRG